MKNAIITTIEQQIKNLAIEAFKNSESEKLNAEEFIEQFEKLCCTEVEKKTKKKRAPVIIPDSERCQALKKDKTRCSARAYLNGKNP